jgi:hypothetical protein
VHDDDVYAAYIRRRRSRWRDPQADRAPPERAQSDAPHVGGQGE